MKTKTLVSKSTVIYYQRNPWLSKAEIAENQKLCGVWCWYNTLTYTQCHPSDPLIDSLKAILAMQNQARLTDSPLSRLCIKAHYYLGKLKRKLTSAYLPSFCHVEHSPRINLTPTVRKIRLVDPDNVIGVFYERLSQLH